MAEYEVTLLDHQLNVLGILFPVPSAINLEEITWRRPWQGVGSCELRVRRESPFLADLLTQGNYIRITRDGDEEAIFLIYAAEAELGIVHYEKGSPAHVNAVYAAGQGEETSRDVVLRTDVAAIATIGRIEAFIDARDIPLGDYVPLAGRADSELAQRASTTSTVVTAGSPAEDEYVTVRGFSPTIYLQGRIALPPPAIPLGSDDRVDIAGNVYDTVTGMPDEVFEYYVENHLIAPADSSRIVPNLVVVPPSSPMSDSMELIYQARFQTILDILREVGAPAGCGFEIRLAGSQLEFSCLPRRDRTTVVFSDEEVLLDIEGRAYRQQWDVGDLITVRLNALGGEERNLTINEVAITLKAEEPDTVAVALDTISGDPLAQFSRQIDRKTAVSSALTRMESAGGGGTGGHEIISTAHRHTTGTPALNDVLSWDGTNWRPVPPSGGFALHSLFPDLTAPADHHTQYALLAGRSTLQTLAGGLASGNLALRAHGAGSDVVLLRGAPTSTQGHVEVTGLKTKFITANAELRETGGNIAARIRQGTVYSAGSGAASQSGLDFIPRVGIGRSAIGDARLAIEETDTFYGQMEMMRFDLASYLGANQDDFAGGLVPAGTFISLSGPHDLSSVKATTFTTVELFGGETVIDVLSTTGMLAGDMVIFASIFPEGFILTVDSATQFTLVSPLSGAYAAFTQVQAWRPFLMGSFATLYMNYEIRDKTGGGGSLRNLYGIWAEVGSSTATVGGNTFQDYATGLGGPATLTSNINASVTTLNYTASGDPILPAHEIRIDTESMLVVSVDGTTNTVTVERAYRGTAAASHTAGASILQRGEAVLIYASSWGGTASSLIRSKLTGASRHVGPITFGLDKYPISVVDVVGTYSPPVGANGRITRIAGTLVEAASGNHTRMAGLEITAPIVTGAAATVTATATLYISGAMTVTVTDANYALWVDAGPARFDAQVSVGTTPNSTAILTVGVGGVSGNINQTMLTGGQVFTGSAGQFHGLVIQTSIDAGGFADHRYESVRITPSVTTSSGTGHFDFVSGIAFGHNLQNTGVALNIDKMRFITFPHPASPAAGVAVTELCLLFAGDPDDGAFAQNVYGVRLTTADDGGTGIFGDLATIMCRPFSQEVVTYGRTVPYYNVFAADTTFGDNLAAGARLDIAPTAMIDRSTEQIAFRSRAHSITLLSGATISTQRSNQFLAPTLVGVAGGSTETVTDAATVYINNAPITGSNITVTRSYALWVDAGDTRLDGVLAVGTNPNALSRVRIATWPNLGAGTDSLADLVATATQSANATRKAVIGISGTYDINGFNISGLDSGLIGVYSVLAVEDLATGGTIEEYAQFLGRFAGAGAAAITDSAVFWARPPTNTGAATSVFHRGVYIENQGDGNFTTSAALDIAAQSGSGTNRTIRALGSAVSIHEPPLMVGATTAPTRTFEVAGSAAVKAGNSSGVIARVGGTLNVNTTAVGNVGTGEDDLMTYSVPAATLNTNNDRISFRASGTIASSVNAKRLRVKFGAATIFDTGAAGIPISAAIDWVLTGEIIREGATAQICSVALFTNNASLATYADSAAATEILSGAVTLKVTGEATANNDVVQETMTVDWLSSP